MTDLEKEKLFRDFEAYNTKCAGHYFHSADSFAAEGISNQAAHEYGNGLEINLKHNIIFDDFRRNPRFNQGANTTIVINGANVQCFEVGTDKWEADVWDNGILKNPQQVRNLILENDPNDERKVLLLDDQNSRLAHLTFSVDERENRHPKGHSIYSYYQMQSPVAKNLLNTEIYTYLENADNYCILALLTEDILSTSPSGKILLPTDFMDKLHENRDLIKYRYPRRYDVISPEDLQFVQQLAHSTQRVNRFRYIADSDVDLVDLTKLSVVLPVELDDYTKRKMFLLLNEREKQMLNDYIKLLLSAGENSIHIKCFITNVVYLKDRVTNGMKIDLPFETEVLGRIDKFTKLMKAFQPFDPNTKYLRDSELFDTEEKRKIYIDKIGQLKIKEKRETTRVNHNARTRAMEIINYLNQGNRNVMYPYNDLKLESGLPVGRAFLNHRDLIDEILFEELKDNPEYETARRMIREYDFDNDISYKVDIFIKMLNEGNSEILNPNNTQVFKGTSLPIRNFWLLNKHVIKRKLEDLKNNPEYETARTLVERYELSRKLLTITKGTSKKEKTELLSKTSKALQEDSRSVVDILKSILFNAYSEAKQSENAQKRHLMRDTDSQEIGKLMENIEHYFTRSTVIQIILKCEDEGLRNYLISHYNVTNAELVNYSEEDGTLKSIIWDIINSPSTTPKFKFMDRFYYQEFDDYVHRETKQLERELNGYKNLLWACLISYIDEKDIWLFRKETICDDILDVDLTKYNIPDKMVPLLKQVAKILKQKQEERNKIAHNMIGQDMYTLISYYKNLYKYDLIMTLLNMYQTDEERLKLNAMDIIENNILGETSIQGYNNVYIEEIKEILNNRSYKK